MRQTWQQSGDSFFIHSGDKTWEGLPRGVYSVYESINGMYLQRSSDEFVFDDKIYDVEESLIDRVKRQYDMSSGNLGVLLNGIKGTGKTVTAKLMCNKLGLPVIRVGMGVNITRVCNYLGSIITPVIVFIDEFEKIVGSSNEESVSLLTLMDGAFSGGRKVFILTTNRDDINDNMIDRPGRIRYIKTFNQLPEKVVISIIDDKLTETQFRDEVIDFVKSLDLVTIDIVKQIVAEVNTHKESPSDFEGVFNASASEPIVYVDLYGADGKWMKTFNSSPHDTNIYEVKENDIIEFDGIHFGVAIKILAPGVIEIENGLRLMFETRRRVNQIFGGDESSKKHNRNIIIDKPRNHWVNLQRISGDNELKAFFVSEQATQG